jgi:hypothetical protein
LGKIDTVLEDTHVPHAMKPLDNRVPKRFDGLGNGVLAAGGAKLGG